MCSSFRQAGFVTARKDLGVTFETFQPGDLPEALFEHLLGDVPERWMADVVPDCG